MSHKYPPPVFPAGVPVDNVKFASPARANVGVGVPGTLVSVGLRAGVAVALVPPPVEGMGGFVNEKKALAVA